MNNNNNNNNSNSRLEEAYSVKVNEEIIISWLELRTVLDLSVQTKFHVMGLANIYVK